MSLSETFEDVKNGKLKIFILKETEAKSLEVWRKGRTGTWENGKWGVVDLDNRNRTV